MLSDPVFYLAAIPAILLFGIAKGGFGGGLGVMSVPLLALVVTPIQAAAILLPILCLMDLFGLYAYRGRWVWPELYRLLPASLAGIAIGTAMFGLMSAAVIRLMLGLIAITFTLHHWWQTRDSNAANLRNFPRAAGVIAAATAGFTSFIAHAGGPPLSMYLLRRGLTRTEFVATTTVFFALVNYVKLIPYAWLGQLASNNLLLSLVLAPLAPIGIYIGVWLHRRVSDRFFFRFAYALLFVVGLKLMYDGLSEF